jgi:hypothetical protein
MAWSTCQAEGRWVRKMEPIGIVGRLMYMFKRLVVWLV